MRSVAVTDEWSARSGVLGSIAITATDRSVNPLPSLATAVAS
jgi:hypothetical protein